jgi:hypothetical protein
VLRKTENDETREVLEVVVPGKVGRGRPKLGWQEEVKKDMDRVGLRKVDAKDRGRWQRGVHELSSLSRKRLPPKYGERWHLKACVCVFVCVHYILNIVIFTIVI